VSQTVGDFLVQRLHDWGVRHLFGYPGDRAIPASKRGWPVTSKKATSNAECPKARRNAARGLP